MTSEASQPPLNWRYCGNQIKRWRTLAGVTREELAKAANYEYETIKSMEQGRRKPSVRLLQVADEMCNAQGFLLGALEFLQPEKFPARTHEFMEAESNAVAVHSYETLLIPGLLQTEEYARTLISNSCPPLDDEAVEARVAGRMQRQERVKCSPTVMFGFVIYEAALHTKVGGREAMKRQLGHLLEAGKLRNVALQVLPADREAYSGLTGSLVLLETTDHDQFAYVEGPETAVLYSDPATVSALTQRHGMIRMQALGIEDSARFIRKAAEEQ